MNCKKSNIHLTLPSFLHKRLLDLADYFAEFHGSCLLYSGGNLDSAQRSFLGLFPYETVTINNHTLTLHKNNQFHNHFVENPWQGLQEHFFSSLNPDPDDMVFGWFGYGMGGFIDPALSIPYRSNSIPDAYWQRCAVTFIVDHHTQELSIRIASHALELVGHVEKTWLEQLSTLENCREFLHAISLLYPQQVCEASSKSIDEDSDRRNSYIEKVLQAQELIRAGEIYQVNLSQEFTCPYLEPPFLLFRQINALNPAPFSAYFRWKETSLVCTSPERFLCKTGQRLETRPIKGTIQRGRTEEEDNMFKARLLASPKERAELLMITDLMRNDLGKVSQTGSVIVESLWRCEAYTNVFHLISIISSIARRELSALEIVQSCFPGGSITGCPKLRSMEVIDDLEKRSRGIYTGSIGYFTSSGDFDLNIAIRTVVIQNDICTLQLGSGIVFDSIPDHEYQETLIKGESFFNLLPSKKIQEGAFHVY